MLESGPSMRTGSIRQRISNSFLIPGSRIDSLRFGRYSIFARNPGSNRLGLEEDAR